MSGIRRETVCAVLMLVTWVTPGVGGEYSHSTGYSFTYPDDWVIVYPRSVVDQGKLPPAVQNWNSKNNINLDKVSMLPMPLRFFRF
jgi:hypothetical protein